MPTFTFRFATEDRVAKHAAVLANVSSGGEDWSVVSGDSEDDAFVMVAGCASMLLGVANSVQATQDERDQLNALLGI
jgi:hypothetical protein